jgi:hypothetical protein
MQTEKISQQPENNKQRYIKHTHKTKDRVTRTPLKTGENSSKHNFSHVHFIFATHLVRKRWKQNEKSCIITHRVNSMKQLLLNV